MNFDQKTILITGASSGIGAATAKLFARAGAKLLLCARRVEKLEQLAAELIYNYATSLHLLPLDVSQSKAVSSAFSALPNEWQNIDVLINNAGLAAGLDTIQDGNQQDWDEMIDTNVKGLLYVTQAVLPGMVERNSGHIFNIGSIAGHQVYPKGAVYCATKKAVHAISEGLRLDLFGTQIKVSTIAPGAVITDFSKVRFKGDEARANAVYEGMQPLLPEDVADAIFYCASRPAHVNINEIFLTPTCQASVSLISRKEKE